MKIADQAALLGMSERHGVFVKNVGDYQVQLILKANVNAIGKMPCLVFVLDKKIDKDVKREILKAQGFLKGYVFFDSIGLIENTVFIYTSVTKKNVEKINEKINKMIDVFKSFSLHSLKTCPFCDELELPDDHRIINGVLINVHETCVKSFIEKSEQEIQEEEQSKGMLKSLIYAFVGAIFGAIPALVALLGFGYFLGVLFAIIPFVSFYFYKYGKGPKTIVPLVIVVLFSLLLVPALMVYIYHSFAMVYGYTLFEAIEIEPEFASEFYGNLGLSFLFSVIGIVISWSYIFRQSTNASKKKLEEFR